MMAERTVLNRAAMAVIDFEELQNARWMSCMRKGDWPAAWRISDRALMRSLPVEQQHRPRHLQRIWDGSSLQGRRVFVRCYHGLGDTVQFVRFMPQLRQLAREVVVWCQPQLLPLLRTAHGIDSLLPLHDGVAAIDYDVDIELMEVPHALRTTLETLPAEAPYFHIAPDCDQPVRDSRPCIGVVWQSGSWDPRRSISLTQIEALMRVPGVAWRVLQRGPALEAGRPAQGEVPDLDGILDEAKAMLSLDLLISVDTLSAHLAGALGVATWTLLPYDADWRWMCDREDTPWYPTMRLFRQRVPGDWSEVLSRVNASLHRLVRAFPARGL